MNIRRRLRRLAGDWSRGQRRASTTTVSDGQRGGNSAESTGGWLATESRSQSEVLGTILILGLSMTAIGIALAGGGVALADLISDAEASNVENGMSHLSSKASLVALGDADSQRFSLGSTQEGTVTVRPDEGTMTITNVTDENRDEVFETNLGAIVYEGKNRKVAYQGGGIWTKRGDNSTMSSPPEYYYRGTTLTLPIIQVSGEGAVGGRTQGQITPVSVGEDAVSDLPTPLEEGVIEIKVQSEYYEGWYEFLTQRTDGETTIDHNNQTVITSLTIPDNVVFEHGLSVGTPYSPHQSVDGDVDFEDRSPHRSAKPIIEKKIKQANESGTGEGCLGEAGSCELDAGTYFYNGDLSLNDNLNLDTSDGNITIIVDGTLDVQSHEVTVTDNSIPENGVTYYINDSLQATGDAFVGTDDPSFPGNRDDTQADRNVFYIGKGLFDSSSGIGNVEFDAVLYAPDATLNINGNGKFSGSIVVGDVEQLQGSIEVNYDSNLANTTIDLTGAAYLITYLHVSHNEIRVELN